MKLIPVLLTLFLTTTETEPPKAPSTMIDDALAKSVVARISEDVAAIRGRDFKQPVPVSVVNDERAIEQNLDAMEEHGAMEEIAASEKVMKLLGLAEEKADVFELFLDALREQIGGYYDPRVGEFYLLDDMPAGMVDILTAHELTHALEDQHFDLDAMLDDPDINDDQLFARSAVSEGSATLLMTIYTVQLAMTDLDESAFGEISDEAASSLPPALLRQMMAPYVVGMTFVQQGNAMGWMAKGYPVADIDRLYTSPPLSSEQILHPEKYWDEAKRDDPVEVSLGNAGEALGSGWSRNYSEVLGELNLAVMAGADTPDAADPAALMGSAWTNRAASGWGGDRYELWEKGDRAVVLLSTVWDTGKDAEEFASAIMKRSVKPNMSMLKSGKQVVFVFGKCPKKRADAALAAMLRGSQAP